mmetsp:Transcript_1537/g.3282  ORF Transcript_1537/g.3282 Transcript_1537/m.3282 type:complete len:542 (-) Transcript_1537:62-1687(-)
MRKKQIDPAKSEAESLAFIKKLDKVTSHRKKETKLKQHRFDYIQAAATMKLQARNLEDDLEKFMAEKLPKSPVSQVWHDLKQETEEIASGLAYKIKALKGLREQLEKQATLVQTFEEKEEWLERAESLAVMFQEVKGGVYAAKDEIFEESVEAPSLQLENEKQALELDVPEIPGLDSAGVLEQYAIAQDKVNEYFSFALESLPVIEQSWPEEQHAKFTLIHSQYIKGGKQRERYFERLHLEFPGLSRQDLNVHDEIIEKIRWTKNHTKNLKKDWERHLLALKQAAEASLSALVQAQADKIVKDLEFLRQQKVAARVEAEANEKRRAYEEKKLELDILQAAQVKRQREAEERQDELRQLYLQQVKAKAQDYKSIKEREQEHAVKLRIEQEKKSKQLQQAKIISKKPIVQQRQKQATEKVIGVFSAKTEALLKAEEEQKRIDAAIESYDHRPKVEIDRNRVQQTTKSKLAKKVEYDKADAVVLFKNTGFTAENLMKDMRYRLSSALNDAGLTGSAYAQSLLNSIPVSRAARPSMASSGFPIIY